VLVPISNPSNIAPLIDLASAIAAAQNGEIVVVRVVVVPDQVSPSREDHFVDQAREMLDEARERAVKRGIRASFLVRIGHNPARAILETSREKHCDLILLGWKGHTTTARRILGEVTDDVVKHARDNIILAKLPGAELPKRLLLPTAGGEHAQLAQEYAAALARWQGGSLTLCSVISPNDPPERAREEEERLRKDKERLNGTFKFDEVDTMVLKHKSVRVGVLQVAEHYDGIVLGAAGQSFTTNILFGSIPEDIARRSKKPTIVVKRHSPVKALLGRVSSE
jgi:nucleotide-binding universal stress UspA family protein